MARLTKLPGEENGKPNDEDYGYEYHVSPLARLLIPMLGPHARETLLVRMTDQLETRRAGETTHNGAGMRTTDERGNTITIEMGRKSGLSAVWAKYETKGADVTDELICIKDKPASVIQELIERNETQGLQVSDLVADLPDDTRKIDGCHTYLGNKAYFQISFNTTERVANWPPFEEFMQDV